MEPDNKNTKELRRLQEIARRRNKNTRAINRKERITKKDLTDYRNIMEFSQSYREMSILRKISRFFKLIGLRFKARKESRKEAHRIHKENRGLLKEEHHATSEQNKMDIKAKREEYKERQK